jgi:MFS family permease
MDGRRGECDKRPPPVTLSSASSTISALLGQRDYVRFWAMRWLVGVGQQIQAVAMGWQVYSLARHDGTVQESALQLGWLGLAAFLPMFLLALPAGWAADHFKRKTTALLCISGEALTIAVLVVITAMNMASVPLLIAVAVLFGLSRAFLHPSTTAMGPMLVPRDLLPRAIAWNSLAWQSASVLGPAIGGVLIAMSPVTAYGAGLALYAVGLFCLASIRTSTKPDVQPGSPLAKVKEGLVYVWRQKIVFGALSLDLVAVLLGGATALLPVFAKDVLHVGPDGFGILRAAPAVGATVVAIALGANPIRNRAGAYMLGGVALFGVATIVFGLSKLPWLSAAALVVLGGADMLSVFVRQTLIQVVTPDAMRGRVAAVSALFISGSNELGEFESGIVARFLGPIGAAVFGGVGAILATGLWAAMFPELRKADRLE